MRASKSVVVKFDGRTGERGAISRVVPGRLVYVQTQPERTYAFKPDKVVIQELDGVFHKYRGEPFEDLGLTVGQTVFVLPAGRGKTEELVVCKNRNRTNPLFSGFIEKFDYLKSK